MDSIGILILLFPIIAVISMTTSNDKTHRICGSCTDLVVESFLDVEEETSTVGDLP